MVVLTFFKRLNKRSGEYCFMAEGASLREDLAPAQSRDLETYRTYFSQRSYSSGASRRKTAVN